MNTLDTTLEETASLLQDEMAKLLPEVEMGKNDRLFEAMRYSALSEGKRLRPYLVIASARLFGVSQSSSLRTAAAIEFVHAYSLVHDDLPAMDNDDLRRGKPSCHKKFDEATAILVGDALLTFAFEILSDEETHSDPIVRAELVSRVAKAAGARGMVGGQMMDLSCEHSELTINEITRLQRLKTGALFSVACEAGAVLGKGTRSQRNALKGYANAVGLAFQITDDLLDAMGTREETGKEVGKDATAGKATYISAMGTDKAQEQARMLINQAESYLDIFDTRADILRELARFIIKRQR